MVVTPTCRYGHGALEKIENEPPNHFWGFIGTGLVEVATGYPGGTPMTSTYASGRTYTVALYRCSTCGYLEMFDDEVGEHG